MILEDICVFLVLEDSNCCHNLVSEQDILWSVGMIYVCPVSRCQPRSSYYEQGCGLVGLYILTIFCGKMTDTVIISNELSKLYIFLKPQLKYVKIFNFVFKSEN